jgi:prevent-host-death family protein
MTKQVKASELQENALALVDEVAATGARIVVTKDGKPVAELGPPQETETRPKRSSFGIWKGKIHILGDIVSPTEPDWDPIK